MRNAPNAATFEARRRAFVLLLLLFITISRATQEEDVREARRRSFL
jgi:hypothetical protein